MKNLCIVLLLTVTSNSLATSCGVKLIEKFENSPGVFRDLTCAVARDMLLKRLQKQHDEKTASHISMLEMKYEKSSQGDDRFLEKLRNALYSQEMSYQEALDKLDAFLHNQKACNEFHVA